MLLCYVPPVATFAYHIIYRWIFRIDLCRFRSEVRSEIIPNTAFDVEKSEDTPFALYQARGEGGPRVNLSKRACPDASHVPCLMLSTMENPKGHQMGLGLKEFRL